MYIRTFGAQVIMPPRLDPPGLGSTKMRVIGRGYWKGAKLCLRRCCGNEKTGHLKGRTGHLKGRTEYLNLTPD